MDSPLKWHGGKRYLARKIIALMPPHLHYVEPYAGSLAVLLEKDQEGVSEVVNDLHYELTNFWCALQLPESFAEFKRRIEAVPFSEGEFKGAFADIPMTFDKLGGMTSHAVNFFVRCRQSLAGRMKDFATLSRNRVRRGMNEQASAWLTAIEGLPEVHARLKRVVILNRPAVDVIRQQDGENTLFYCDAPYVSASRATTGEYKHEMTDDQHRELIEILLKIKGRAIVSMYHHEIYDVLHLKYGWRLVEFNLPNNASGGITKRRMTECCWMNYPSNTA